MKHRYTAKIYLENGEILINSGDNVEELTAWINAEVESNFDEVKGEVIDNNTETVVKSIQYSSPE